MRGFHLIDSKSNLFVLEGLAHFGIKFLFEKLPKDKNMEVLYNSNIKFSQCLYTELEVELLTIKLFEPLEEIVKKPLLYVRDMTPKSSFEALIKLNEVTCCLFSSILILNPRIYMADFACLAFEGKSSSQRRTTRPPADVANDPFHE